ncbi:MAG: hypothetical protein U0559_01780 [Anaerolineae bacterium]
MPIRPPPSPISGAGIVVDGAVSNIIGITNNDGNVIAVNPGRPRRSARTPTACRAT